MTVPAAPPAAPAASSAPASAPAAPSADDVVARVAKQSVTPTLVATDPDAFDVEGFNRNDIEKITDPAARQYLEGLAKSLKAGYMKKFQIVAEKEKKLGQPSPTVWTPESVRKAMVDPAFQSAARTVVGSPPPTGGNGNGRGDLTDEQWSVLTDDEKREFTAMRHGLSHMNNEFLSWKQEQEDRTLAERYGANYDPAAISQLQTDLISGTVIATREHLHKVRDYDDAIRRAYDLGRTDERQGIVSKANGQPLPGGGANTPVGGEPPSRSKGESGASYFVRLAQNRLAQVGRKP